jgi:hypothetical protein
MSKINMSSLRKYGEMSALSEELQEISGRFCPDIFSPKKISRKIQGEVFPDARLRSLGSFAEIGVYLEGLPIVPSKS